MGGVPPPSNRQLRENNSRARSIAEGLADTAERNVRNLQDAVGLISEIRTKLKVLADFYVNGRRGNPAGIINFPTIDEPRSLLRGSS